jgi:hypothetical protein
VGLNAFEFFQRGIDGVGVGALVLRSRYLAGLVDPRLDLGLSKLGRDGEAGRADLVVFGIDLQCGLARTFGLAPPEAPSALKTMAVVSLASFPGALFVGGKVAEAIATDEMTNAMLSTGFNAFGALASMGCGITALVWGRRYAPTGVRTPALIGALLGTLGVLAIGFFAWQGIMKAS